MLSYPGEVVGVDVGVDGGDEDEAKGAEGAVAVAAGLPKLQGEQMVDVTLRDGAEDGERLLNREQHSGCDINAFAMELNARSFSRVTSPRFGGGVAGSTISCTFSSESQCPASLALLVRLLVVDVLVVGTSARFERAACVG